MLHDSREDRDSIRISGRISSFFSSGHVHPFHISLAVFFSDVETSHKNTPQDVKIRDLSSTAAQKIFQEPLCRENLYTQTTLVTSCLVSLVFWAFFPRKVITSTSWSVAQTLKCRMEKHIKRGVPGFGEKKMKKQTQVQVVFWRLDCDCCRCCCDFVALRKCLDEAQLSSAFLRWFYIDIGMLRAWKFNQVQHFCWLT